MKAPVRTPSRAPFSILTSSLYATLSALLSLGLGSACAPGDGPEKGASLRLGAATQTEVLQKMGPPNQKTETGNKNFRTEVWTYGVSAQKQNFQFQTVGSQKTLIARTRRPAHDERTLQYWKHKWKGEKQYFEPLGGIKTHSDDALMQLRVPRLHLAVIYNSSRDTVVEVLEYAAH